MTLHAALLSFIICGTAYGLDGCEEGRIEARSCAAAEAWLRAGLREGQSLRVLECRE
ncbi:hypothetical protein [Sediminicoccus sp. KRV36]|uniref:hypothetical protein n=1 Tax=Sediminicoccus sp. KRV36 TaxID=3133721 RepID=UPI00200E1789|nr:hypothetical protein [Sediminicoccus rosea]UPY35509.1 hypothetical protein LHU95_14920 [Sediminicoccus rosea]